MVTACIGELETRNLHVLAVSPAGTAQLAATGALATADGQVSSDQAHRDFCQQGP